MNPEILLMLPVLLFSLSVHEFAHAWTAKKGGDMTATLQGRTTLNPIVHIDPVGTVILPVVLAIVGAPIFGWAKPVPVSETQLKHSRWLIWVSMAGPASNILIALTVAIILKIVFLAGGEAAILDFTVGARAGEGNITTVLYDLARLFLVLNIALAVFNMLPIPPLDGSKLLYYFVIRRNPQFYEFWISLNQFGFIAIYFLFMIKPVREALIMGIRVPMRLLMNWLGV